MSVSIVQAQEMNGLNTILECLTGMGRVLGTLLSLAYNIAISQSAWAYILVLPFQLYTPLGWIAIPGTLGKVIAEVTNLAAAYIILGIAAIRREIENSFGKDVNNLDIEGYIRSLTVELDILMSLLQP